MTIDEKILSLEKAVAVDTYTFNSEPIWPLIRMNIYLSESKSGGKKVSVKKALIFFFLGLVDSLKSYFSIRRTVDNVLITTSHYKVWENGQLHDKILDPVLKHLQRRSESYQVWEFTSDYQFSSKISYRQFMYPIQRKLYVRHRLRSLFKPSNFPLGGDIEKLNTELASHDLSFRVNEAFIQKVSLTFDNVRFFKKQLEKVRAQRVFVVCYYDAKGFALVKAANDLKIPIVDLQHGVQGERHLAYARWPSNLIHSKFLPSHFYVWNQHSYETIGAWKHDISKILLGCNQWVLERVRKISNEILLVSLQPIEGFIPEVLLTEIRDYQGDKKWYLRLHPTQLHQLERVEDVVKSWGIVQKVNVRDASALPLTTLLERTALHVTFYSSVAVEASYYNVATYFLSQQGATMYRKIIPERLSYCYPENKLCEVLRSVDGNSFEIVDSRPSDLSILDRFINAPGN